MSAAVPASCPSLPAVRGPLGSSQLRATSAWPALHARWGRVVGEGEGRVAGEGMGLELGREKGAGIDMCMMM